MNGLNVTSVTNMRGEYLSVHQAIAQPDHEVVIKKYLKDGRKPHYYLVLRGYVGNAVNFWLTLAGPYPKIVQAREAAKQLLNLKRVVYKKGHT